MGSQAPKSEISLLYHVDTRAREDNVHVDCHGEK